MTNNTGLFLDGVGIGFLIATTAFLVAVLLTIPTAVIKAKGRPWWIDLYAACQGNRRLYEAAIAWKLAVDAHANAPLAESPGSQAERDLTIARRNLVEEIERAFPRAASGTQPRSRA
jgi:hypothetical protein